MTQFKRGDPVPQIWSHISVPWTDRFGNTALHIAAALGAQYSDLRSMIQGNIFQKALNVHQVNTANQTFMHVLNPSNLNLKDMLHLKKDLQAKDFDFYQRDVQGQTFLEPLACWGLDPLDFARCWLRPTAYDFTHDNHRKKEHLAYSHAKELFEISGGSNT